MSIDITILHQYFCFITILTLILDGLFKSLFGDGGWGGEG